MFDKNDNERFLLLSIKNELLSKLFHPYGITSLPQLYLSINRCPL